MEPTESAAPDSRLRTRWRVWRGTASPAPAARSVPGQDETGEKDETGETDQGDWRAADDAAPAARSADDGPGGSERGDSVSRRGAWRAAFGIRGAGRT
ncbi:hypothetical protein ACWFRM_13620, partial [Streptomyces sp. NPDC055144]